MNRQTTLFGAIPQDGDSGPASVAQETPDVAGPGVAVGKEAVGGLAACPTPTAVAFEEKVVLVEGQANRALAGKKHEPFGGARRDHSDERQGEHSPVW